MRRKLILFVAFVLTVSQLALAQDEPVFFEQQSQETALMPVAIENKITLDIKGMDIVDVLKMLAQRSGMNIVVGKNVTGRVTLFLKNVDAWDAFEIILFANELAYEKKDDVITVMTQRDYELIYGDRFQDKKQAKIIPLKYARAANLAASLNQLKSNIGKIVVDEGSNTLAIMDIPGKLKEMADFINNTDLPLQTRIFDLNYAQAEKISPKIQEALTKGVGSIKIDERTNKIAVTDYPEKLEEIDKVIRAFDEKTPQVLIDAQIIELTPSDKLEMGVDWDYWIEKNLKVSGQLPIGTTNRLLVGTPAQSPSEKGDYKAILDLLRTIGDTKILSSPRIMVLNNQEAKILIGTKDAYITSTSSVDGYGSTVSSQSVNFVDVGIKLFVTPNINRQGFVTMKIRPEISSSVRTSLTAQGTVTQVPIVTTSEAETTVMVKDGITIIIGGLKKDKRERTIKKIPLLGDIPLLGLAFRNTSDELSKSELVILLTPHIMSGESPFTDFADATPKNGVVARMEKGDIITERTIAIANRMSMTDYSNLLTDKIKNAVMADYPRKEKGRVTVAFTISRTGALISKPSVSTTDNPDLKPFAVRAVENAQPFEPFPEYFEKDKETFRINLIYE